MVQPKRGTVAFGNAGALGEVGKDSRTPPVPTQTQALTSPPAAALANQHSGTSRLEVLAAGVEFTQISIRFFGLYANTNRHAAYPLPVPRRIGCTWRCSPCTSWPYRPAFVVGLSGNLKARNRRRHVFNGVAFYLLLRCPTRCQLCVAWSACIATRCAVETAKYGTMRALRARPSPLRTY